MRYPLLLSLFAALGTLTGAARPAFAQRDAKVPDPDPELERKTFILPEGFEVHDLDLDINDPAFARAMAERLDELVRGTSAP